MQLANNTLTACFTMLRIIIIRPVIITGQAVCVKIFVMARFILKTIQKHRREIISIQAFSKRFILTPVRIGHATKLIMEQNFTIIEVREESGYNN
jgi:hypothetical protein